jgi:tRNA(Ile)-lysidine synthase
MFAGKVRQFFVNRGFPPCRIAAAVSGGVDSTALLLALGDLRAEGFTILAAHVNHHLRGADSAADEAFVRDLCARLGVELVVFDGTLDPELVRSRGIEAAAREVRYARLREVAADYVATAHQKNDQAETVLMRILTGSGIAGLRGIHPVREDGFVRPLLDVTRAEIEELLRERNVVARLDRSNEDPRFLRNRIRTFLGAVGGIDALAGVAEQARAQWPLLERAIDAAERAHAEVREDQTRFRSWPEDAWLRGALLQRHIRRLDPEARDFDASRIASEVEAIRRASVTKHLELVRNGSGWILRRPPERTEAFELELTESQAATIPALGVTLRVTKLSPPLPSPRDERGEGGAKRRVRGRATCEERPLTLTLSPRKKRAGRGDFQLIQLPDANASPTFTVRNRRNGDRFQPLGLPRPKKLKDFLIDRKIAAELRDRLPLLVWNGEIVWVAGVEVSERFKVTDPPGVLYEVSMDDDQAGLHR